MAKNLVIVESPAKAKTLSSFLGDDFEVKSSYGHIRDLPKKQLGVDVAKDFEPTYQTPPDKQRVAKELKAAAKGAEVWLASDEDREGEAIAWHVCVLLGLDPSKTKRIVFHEITKPAVMAAIDKPRTVDTKLVDAQQARRILDRLVGYELSPVLWKKVRTGLSAGRVQSVAVRLIVEREREIKNFQPETGFKLSAELSADGQNLTAELPDKLSTEAKARDLLEAVRTAELSLTAVDQKPGSRSPGMPFTTSSLQQEAARRLGFSVRQTMTLAQRLYEAGHITYMRTDSPNLSGQAQAAVGDHIVKQYGQNYHQLRQFKAKSATAQEAHEAIRPSNIGRTEAGSDNAQRKLYDLIWRRAVASQMAAAAVMKTEATIAISGRSEQLVAKGEVLTFDGWLKVYGGGKEDKILPPLKVGQKLELIEMLATETLSRPPARYSEASLVRKLEELGIGRPSTYAPTIGTIQDRGYVTKTDVEGELIKAKQLRLSGGQISDGEVEVTIGADRNKLLPTDLAGIVTDFLMKFFERLMDYDFTARAEAQLDEIADGKRQWRQMLAEFYERFHSLIEQSEQASRAEATQARQLGVDPKTKQPVITRFGRYGPVLQLGQSPDPKDKTAPKPKFAPLPQGVSQDDVTLEQALPMFDLPRLVGQTERGDDITASIGPYGPFIRAGKLNVGLKDIDPFSVDEAQARQLLADKAKAEAERVIADFGAIKILRGPYGPFVTDGKKNAKVEKTTDPESLDETAAKRLLAAAPDKPRRFRRPKKRS